MHRETAESSVISLVPISEKRFAKFLRQLGYREVRTWLADGPDRFVLTKSEFKSAPIRVEPKILKVKLYAILMNSS